MRGFFLSEMSVLLKFMNQQFPVFLISNAIDVKLPGTCNLIVLTQMG
jgi:hypothetical protein